MAIQKKLTVTASFDEILELITALRSDSGCPWDRQQTPNTLTTYLIEEMYELVEAIVADDTDAICDELGDVIFQILFVAHLFQADGRFTLQEALGHNKRKMIRRHPHVFGEQKLDTTEQVKSNWRRIKQQEKGDTPQSLLGSVPEGMPALMRAYRLSERAAGIGFDWDSLKAVMSQAVSEWSEFQQEVDARSNQKNDPDDKTSMEFGDVLFTLVNVARKANIHPEKALIQSIQKFVSRFQQMEALAVEKEAILEDLTQDEMERLWAMAKKSER